MYWLKAPRKKHLSASIAFVVAYDRSRWFILEYLSRNNFVVSPRETFDNAKQEKKFLRSSFSQHRAKTHWEQMLSKVSRMECKYIQQATFRRDGKRSLIRKIFLCDNVETWEIAAFSRKKKFSVGLNVLAIALCKVGKMEIKGAPWFTVSFNVENFKQSAQTQKNF